MAQWGGGAIAPKDRTKLRKQLGRNCPKIHRSASSLILEVRNRWQRVVDTSHWRNSRTRWTNRTRSGRQPVCTLRHCTEWRQRAPISSQRHVLISLGTTRLARCRRCRTAHYDSHRLVCWLFEARTVRPVSSQVHTVRHDLHTRELPCTGDRKRTEFAVLRCWVLTLDS